MPESSSHKRRPSYQSEERISAELQLPEYAELYVTSNFSFLRGASHPDEYVMEAAKLGHCAVALTDLHSLAGIVRAHVAAKECGIQLVVGSRIELAIPNSAQRFSLLLYPTSLAAYSNLSRLLTLGKRRAPKGECHLTLHDCIEHQAGLLAIVVPPLPEHGDFVPDHYFVEMLTSLRRVFDDDRLSIAARRLFTSDDHRILSQLHELSRHVSVPLVATNDVHYHTATRRALQDVVTCIRLGTTIGAAGYQLFQNGERYLKSGAEMARLFADYPRAISRTLDIARRCASFSLDQVKYEYPEEICPKGRKPLEYLRELTMQGAAQRFSKPLDKRSWYEPDNCVAIAAQKSNADAQINIDLIPLNIREILDHEFAIIERLGYAKYFLTVYDLVAFARSRGILCQGRGAAANSAVCYCLGITSVDPTRIDLLFERFVSTERGEPPDIDIDFEHERREEVIQYVYTKYGRHRAALVAEVVSYRGRSAVREVGKALGLSLDLVDRMAKELHRWTDGPPDPAQLRALGLDPTDRTLSMCIELTQKLVGFPRHLSQHVGGFIIAQQNLSDLVPIENASMPERTVIEWDKDDVDCMGMLKVDCLGLGMLTCIRKALAFYNEAPGRTQPMQMHQIPKEDPAVYDMICAADTVGVFQIESRAQMSMLPRLKPREFYDLVIEVAIVRPGPIQGNMVHPYLHRRNGEEEVTFPTPAVQQVLAKTLGVPLFQEQAMRLAVVAAGFSPGKADQLRRAMAAWRRSGRLMDFESDFVSGMLANGYTRDFADRCFQQLKGFSEYGFPESHAASFALLVYVSSWLKKHHPALFCAALINSLPMGFYAPAQLVRDAKEHGVDVRPIDINHSAWDCTLEYSESDALATPSLRIGMRLVKSLPQIHGNAIAAAVKRHGPFSSIEALWRASGVPVAALRALARADAFRSMNLDRRQALWRIEPLRDEPLPLFDECPSSNDSFDQVRLPSMPLYRHVVHDYDSHGLSLKAHPLSFIRDELNCKKFVTTEYIRSEKCRAGMKLRVAGLVLIRQRPATASGVVFMTIEDEFGSANLILWPDVFARFRRAARLSTCIAATGKVERQGLVIHVVVSRIVDLQTVSKTLQGLRAVSRDFH